MDGVGDQVHATSKRQVTGAGGDALHGEVDGSERGGTGRVDGHAGPLKIQMIGNLVGDGVEIGVAGVGAVHDAHKDPDLVVRSEAGRRVAGVLDGGVGDF